MPPRASVHSPKPVATPNINPEPPLRADADCQSLGDHGPTAPIDAGRQIQRQQCEVTRGFSVLFARMFQGATVRDGAAVRLGIYFRGNWAAKDVWVVYKNSQETALKSPDMVLVCKRKGRVFYEGSAQDEG